jgi:AmmeMemoRadiSam system protein A
MFRLSESGQSALLRIARNAVRSYLSGQTPVVPEVSAGELTEPRAVFVSIHLDQRLRGCIGNLRPDGPLFRVAADCAVAAAVADPRFVPLMSSELTSVTFEISVLSAPERVSQPHEIEIGKHGVIVQKGQYQGLLLPQVASQYNWDTERFLSETCRKAGLRPEEWRQGSTIHRFTAHVFSEATVPHTANS